MALKTIGTPATNTLSGFVVNVNDFITADVATLMANIKNDLAPSATAGGVGGSVGIGQLIGGAYAQQGLLTIPNRGVLRCLPGDFVAFDTTTGWPILISALAAGTGASWTHS